MVAGFDFDFSYAAVIFSVWLMLLRYAADC